jgi:hypothetical protein
MRGMEIPKQEMDSIDIRHKVVWKMFIDNRYKNERVGKCLPPLQRSFRKLRLKRVWHSVMAMARSSAAATLINKNERKLSKSQDLPKQELIPKQKKGPNSSKSEKSTSTYNRRGSVSKKVTTTSTKN